MSTQLLTGYTKNLMKISYFISLFLITRGKILNFYLLFFVFVLSLNIF